MTDYIKATNFASKDTLPVGNANKKIKGTEIDIELNAISSSVATKADINSPVLTGTPLAPTATASTNTTQIATTAFVQAQKASPEFTGTPIAPTATTGTDTTQLATTEFVQQEITANAYTEPYATQLQKGVVRAYLSSGNLYIYTQD